MIPKTAHSCGVCGAPTATPHRAPAPELAPDLDLRPGEPTRSTLKQWIMVCRQCGAAAPDLSVLTPAARPILDTENYRTLRGTGSKFRRYAAICLANGNRKEAGAAMLQAAWSADDANEDDNARIWRLEAAALWADPPDEETALRRIDALRRAQEFAQAEAEAAAWVSRVRDGEGRQILAFQRARIAAADAGSYRISSALRPPAHSPHVAHGKRPAAKGFLARLFGR